MTTTPTDVGDDPGGDIAGDDAVRADIATIAEEEDARDDGALAILPPRRPVNLEAINTLRDHVSAMRDAKFFADIICYSKLVPERYFGKPGDGAAAILFGFELGLSPIASLRSVIVIHGNPGLEARTMKALLKGKGYRFKTHEASLEAYDIEAWSPDGEDNERSRWTIDDAVRAGYVPIPSSPDSERRPGVQGDWVTVTKTWDGRSRTSVAGNMKYITDPRAMLRAKATAEVCRDIAPHILLGLPYAAEELEDFDDDGDIAEVPRPPRRARGVNRLRERAAEKQHPEVIDADEAAPAPHDAPAEEETTPPTTPPAEARPAPVPETPAAEKADHEDSPPPPPPPASAAPAAATAPPPPTASAGAAGGGGLSPSMRARGDALLTRLLAEAKVEDPGDRRLVIAEIAAKAAGAAYRTLADGQSLTDAELKYVVDTLTTWKTKGKLYEHAGEALNASALREAGMLDAQEQA